MTNTPETPPPTFEPYSRAELEASLESYAHAENPERVARYRLIRQLLDAMDERDALRAQVEAEQRRLKNAIGGLRSIAYGETATWPNCSSREVAKHALQKCGGEKAPPATPTGKEG